MHLSFKYRIYPSSAQRDFLSKQFGCCRYVYNHFLKEISENPDVKVNGKLYNLLTILRKTDEASFLREVSSVALQQSIANLIMGYKNFFDKRAGYPKLKCKNGPQSYRLVGSDAFDIRGNKLYLAKCPGLIKIKLHRAVTSEPTSVTVTMNSSGQYFASFVCETDEVASLSENSIGIDLGIKDFCITSKGNKYDNPRYFVNSEKRLAKLQRQLSRKQKGSNNRNKSRLKVAKHHQHVVNQRNDFLHKLSTKLIRENQVICLEDLNASGMMRNRCLAKHIADVSWNRFCVFLTYKAMRYNRQLMVMNTFTPSTQTCSTCHVQRQVRLTLKERWWSCDNCGAVHDRDINAARVIHSVGMQYWHKECNNLATLMLVPRWKNGEFVI